jgi:hypothetical protein
MPAGKKGLQATAPQITPPKPQVPKPPQDESSDSYSPGPMARDNPEWLEVPEELQEALQEAVPETTTDRLDRIDRQCALAENEAELDQIWETIQPLLADGFPPDIDAANKIRARHKKRLGIA